MPSVLILLSNLQHQSGNKSTVNRILQHLIKHGFTSKIQDPTYFTTSRDLNEYLKREHIGCILGIHLYKTGYILQDCKVPYIMIVGGTDVNKYHTDIQSLEIMTSVVERARYLIIFGDSLKKRVFHLWPNTSEDKIVEIKQAVITKPSSFCLLTYLKSINVIKDCDDNCDIKLFVMPCGIRAVKDPLFLVTVMSEWHKENENIYFVIIGPKLEEDYFENFMKTISRLPGVIYIPGLTSSQCHAAISQSFALVNSSKSEGMSLAILEAMQLKTIVFARNIAGNSDLIVNNQTGILYNTPQEFIKSAKELLTAPKKMADIIENAKIYVEHNHNIVKEEMLYSRLLNECCGNY